MINDKIFVDGLRFYAPRETAPEFVIGTLTIDPNELIKWMQQHADHRREWTNKTTGATGKEFRINVNLGRDGKPYCALDTWKPEPKSDDGWSSQPKPW